MSTAEKGGAYFRESTVHNKTRKAQSSYIFKMFKLQKRKCSADFLPNKPKNVLENYRTSLNQLMLKQAILTILFKVVGK